MKNLLTILSILILSFPLFGQSERPETIIIPVSSLGNVSEVRKQILQNTLTDELKKNFRIVPQEKFEKVLEQVFEELEYEECSEDACIMRVQEMLQVENVFNLQVLGEDKDSQLNLKWITLDEKKNEEDYCKGCETFELREMTLGLIEKLVKKPVIKETKVYKTKGFFVSVGRSGTIITSPDGNWWTKRTSGTSDSLYGITYGNGVLVTVSSEGNIYISSDGTTWNRIYSGTGKSLYGVTYGNGIFVVVGYRTILTSQDGNSWTKINAGRRRHLRNVSYVNDTFVTVGIRRTILTSLDGNSWTSGSEQLSRTSGLSKIRTLNGFTYGNGTFVTVGDSGTIVTSTDGNSWKKRTYGNIWELMEIIYGNGMFMTVGHSGTIVTSLDGKSWRRNGGPDPYDLTPTSYQLNGVIYGNGTFVTVGHKGTILTSTDGNIWAETTSGTPHELLSITYTKK